MNYTLSKHAEDAIKEREIRSEWIAACLTEPMATEADPVDPDIRHALRIIDEFGYRVLRVIYNQTTKPAHVVTVYFDRTMKGKL
jgi:Domain of unknown function (DUF4258)